MRYPKLPTLDDYDNSPSDDDPADRLPWVYEQPSRPETIDDDRSDDGGSHG